MDHASENRLDMALTGIKTPVGMKIQGTNLEQIQQLGAQVQQDSRGYRRYVQFLPSEFRRAFTST